MIVFIVAIIGSKYAKITILPPLSFFTPTLYNQNAKAVGKKMVTSCPKCRIHLTCLRKDYDDFSSIEILDFSEFLVDMIEIVDLDIIGEEKE